MSEIQKPDLIQAINEAHNNFKAAQAVATDRQVEADQHGAGELPKYLGEEALYGDDVQLESSGVITQEKYGIPKGIFMRDKDKS